MRRLGPYEVLAELARGGMGVVYRARDPRLNREVAIKVLLRARGQGTKGQLRFEREIEALGRLKHPHVVSVHASGYHEGAPYLVLDLVEGQSLQDRLSRGGPIEPKAAAALVAKVARALQHAHDQGVLHRDVKPDNVLLDHDGEPYLTDFGLARWIEPDDSTRVSVSGMIMGTAGYLPPEQAHGERDKIDVRSDVFGAGALLFAALTGQAPFAADSMLQLLAALGEPAPPVASLRPDVPRALAAVVARSLELDRDDRYPTAGDLAAALESWETAPQPPRRRKLALAGVLLAALLGTVAAFVAVRADAEPGPGVAASPTAEQTLDPEQQLLAAVKQGEHAALLEHSDLHEPGVVARIAAWVDDRVALEAALARLPQPRARALAWELRAYVPDVLASEGPLLASGDDPWEAVAAGEECLARGLVGPAALAFAQAQRLAGSAKPPRRAARLGLLRVALARGDEAALDAQITLIQEDDPDTLTLIRLLAASFEREQKPVEELAEIFPGHPAVVVARLHERWRNGESPGHDGLKTLPWLARLREAVRLRADATRSELLGRVALEGQTGSWTRTERELCRRGLDGPLGLRLAQGADLAHAALEGQAPEAAAEAEALLRDVGARRPTSPLLWYALAQTALVRGQPREAGDLVRKAGDASPDDPQVLLLRARIEHVLALDAGANAATSLLRARERFLEALAAAPAGDPLAARARLGAAHASASRRSLLLDQPDRAAQALDDLTADLAPLLAPFDGAFHRARRGLIEADARGDEPALWESARTLLRRLPTDPWALRPLASALALRARGGGEAGALAARAYQCLLGDLPARAVATWRETEGAPEQSQRRAGLDRALELWPGSPDLLYASACLALSPDAARRFAATPSSYLILGRVAARSPRRAAAVADLLQSAGELPDRGQLNARVKSAASNPVRAEALLARALWFLRKGAVDEDPAASVNALRDARQAVTLNPDCWGARLVAARALERTLDPRAGHGEAPRGLVPELLAELRPVEIAAPWLTAPLSIRLAYSQDWAERARLADRLLAQGYLILPQQVLPDAAATDLSNPTARRLGQLRDWLIESALPNQLLRNRSSLRRLHLALADLRDPAGQFMLPLTTVTLQIASDAPPPPLEGLLPQLPPRLRPVVSALVAQNVGGPNSGWILARESAREAMLVRSQATPLVLPTERLWPQGLRVGLRAPLQDQVEPVTIGPDPVLAASTFQLYVPTPALSYALTTDLPPGLPLDPDALGGPQDRGAAHLALLHLGALQQRAGGALAGRRAWREARHAIMRAAAFSGREDFDEVLAEEGGDELLHRSHLVQDKAEFSQQIRRLAELGLRLPSRSPTHRLMLRNLGLAGALWARDVPGADRAALLAEAVELAKDLSPEQLALGEEIAVVKAEATWFKLVLAVIRGDPDPAALAAGATELHEYLAECGEPERLRARQVITVSPYRDQTLSALGDGAQGLLLE